MNPEFLLGIHDLGYKLTNLKEVLKLGSVKFAHGDMLMIGQTGGKKTEKSAKTLKKAISFIGHIHYPSIRFGCYSVGLSGKLDQGYNEPSASKWVHGFGLSNEFEGKAWGTTIPVSNNKFIINKKVIEPIDKDSWKAPPYKAKLIYDYS